MNEERYRLVDGKYFPIPRGIESLTLDECQGDYWRAWKDQSRYYLEYDEGHFSTKMKIIIISEPDFHHLAQGTKTVAEVVISQ
jgi:hypothetical protein